MKVLIIVTLAIWFFGRSSKKESTSQAPCPASPPQTSNSSTLPKAPDCDRPEQFLWSVMFGDNQKHSTVVRLLAAIVFVGSQVAIEVIKAYR